MSSIPTHQTAAVIKAAHVSAEEIVIDHKFNIPTLNEDDILVRNQFAGVNPLDCKVRQYGFYLNSFPAVLGVDFSGIVVAIGSKVTKFKVGDSVTGCNMTHIRGTYSQYVVCAESQAAHTPESISHKVASSCPVTFLTAFQCFLKHPSCKSGEKGSFKGRVLIIGGSGGVGMSAILLAKHYFNAEKIVTISSAKNEEFVRKLGADEVLDYSKGKESLTNELESLKGSFDLVLDFVGSYQEYYSIELLKQDGESQFVTIVHSPQGIPNKIFGAERVHNLYAERDGNQLAVILQWLSESGLWKEIPIHVFSLEQASQAQKMSESNRTVGKIILEIP